MRRRIIYPAEISTQSLGQLQVNARTNLGFRPIENAEISISLVGMAGSPLEVLQTNNSGQTIVVDLPAPPVEYSMEPSAQQPYSEYTVTVRSPGYENVVITGTQIFPQQLAIQNAELFSPTAPTVQLRKQEQINGYRSIVIGPHRLFGDFPPKIPEAEVKDIEATGEIVLDEVVIPEFVIVHDGPPDDPVANNYYVRFRDYIKNVASSEIYSTWPESTIQANVLAILSFTLNRVFTEWYRGKGYNFTITSSTAYDHKWVYGRNIFENISQIVDSLFINYLARPGIEQPILTQYCDGVQVQCPNWMTL